jgi:hypothetical protein
MLSFGYINVGNQDMQVILIVSQVLTLFSIIFFLTWIFSFRNRINILSESDKGSQFWLVHCQFNLDGYLESKALALARSKAKALDSNSRQKHLDNVLGAKFYQIHQVQH